MQAESAMRLKADSIPRSDPGPEIIIATIMRAAGETGVQTHINELGNYLAGAGVPSRVVTPFSYSRGLVMPVFAVRRLMDPLSGKLSVWWYNFFHTLFLQKALERQLVHGNPVVIYCSCPFSAKAAIRARRSASQKVMMAVHFNESMADEWATKGKIKSNDWVYRQISALEGIVIPKLNGLVFLSHYMMKRLKRRLPEVGELRSIVLPNFIAAPSRQEPREIHHDLVSIGTLEPRKNQEYLLRVVAMANERGHRYTLTLIGDGPDRAKLRALSKELGIESQVEFLGFRPKAAKLLQGYRAYVHSALIENIPLSVIEALACGLPVFSAAVGGLREMISDGVEGYFWDLADPRDGADRLIALLEHREAYDRTAQAARARFEQCFNAKIVADRLRDFLLTA